MVKARYLAFAFLFAACASHGALNQPNEEAAIRAVLARYDESWATHNPDLRAPLFANDVIMTNVTGTTREGPQARGGFSGDTLYQKMYHDAVMKFQGSTIRFIKPDVAVVIAPWMMTGAKHPDGTSWENRKGNLQLVMQKLNGAWLIKAFHNLEIPPR